MIICPKCGREYLGDKCPYCDGLDVFDNTEEYKKRRLKYEQYKDKTGTQGESGSDDAIQKLNSLFKKAKSEKIASDAKNIFKKVRWVLLAAAIAIAIVIIVINLPYIYNGKLFISDAKSIYKYNGSEFVQEQSSEDLDNIPKDILGDGDKTVSQTVSSSGNKYFACVIMYAADNYDSLGKNVLYVWDKDGSYEKVTESSKNISVKELTDDGTVIFTSTDIYDAEWHMGEVSAHIYKYKGSLSQIEDNVKYIGVYESNRTIVIVDSDGGLYTCGFDSVDSKLSIASDVDMLALESDTEEGLFSYSATSVNTRKGADKFMYQKENKWYMTDFNGSEVTAFGILSDSDASFAYNKKTDTIYAFTSKGIKTSKKLSEKSTDVPFSTVDTLDESKDFIWNGKNRELLFVNGNKELVNIDGFNNKVLACNIVVGSLRRVKNSDSYLYAISEDDGTYSLYYSDSFNKVGNKLASNITLIQSDVCKQGDKLFYISSGNIYSIALNNGDISQVHKAEYFWIEE